MLLISVCINWQVQRKISSKIRITLRGLFVFSIMFAIFLSIPPELINSSKRFNIFQNSIDTSSLSLAIETIQLEIDPSEGLLVAHNPILVLGLVVIFYILKMDGLIPIMKFLQFLSKMADHWLYSYFFYILVYVPRIRAGITGWSFFLHGL